MIAALSALLTGGKFVFAMVPNIEVVTLFIAVIASSLKTRHALTVVSVFVTCEMFLYGINTWILSYYIYWNALVFVVHFASMSRRKYIIMPCVCAVMTFVFGVLTTLIDVLILTDLNNFAQNYAIMYLRGGWFYLTHIVSNAIIITICYPILDKIFNKLYRNYFNDIDSTNSNLKLQ